MGKKSPQPVVFDIEFSLPSRDACNTDRIEDTVDYGEVIQLIRNFLSIGHSLGRGDG
jgi:dihydroneopterin aldolase